MSGKGEKEQVYARYVTSGKTQEHLASWGKTLAEVMNPEGKPEVLDEVLVLDASLGNFSGIIAASFLAEFGAEVIKIEPPEGDPMRKITPYGANVKGVGIPFLVEGRNKRYLTLDLKNSEQDRKEFARLAEKAAVIIETFAPGEMDSWGIGYRQLSQKNPGSFISPSLPMATIRKRPSSLPTSRIRTLLPRPGPAFRLRWVTRRMLPSLTTGL